MKLAWTVQRERSIPVYKRPRSLFLHLQKPQVTRRMVSQGRLLRQPMSDLVFRLGIVLYKFLTLLSVFLSLTGIFVRAHTSLCTRVVFVPVLWTRTGTRHKDVDGSTREKVVVKYRGNWSQPTPQNGPTPLVCE